MDYSEKQKILDEEHLRLLRIGYLVDGWTSLFFAFFPLIYVIVGIFIVAAGPSVSRRPGDPDPALLGSIFVVVGIVIFVILAALAILKLLTARALGQRRSRTLCFVAAAITCLSMPYGTLLGVFTFLVLGRPSVKQLFDTETAAFPPAPPGPPPSLFSNNEMAR
ncbi:MAG: hypothetical protein L0229_07725 [Blastocatellia bacterium]|nr:hypothetical protein [Blastocatellia bacterium]